MRRPIRISLILLSALVGNLAFRDPQTSLAQETTPYAATVIVNEAPIRSGPAAKYYVTDLLDRGANVEVYKNILGWCAIRPPKDSFCWIPARQVRLDGSGKVAEVIDPETYAWIGSNIATPKEHGFQIQLNVGEKLAIIGEKRFERTKQQVTETYYKVEPPSGEFRWVESRFLSKPPASAAKLIAAIPDSENTESIAQRKNTTSQVSHDEEAKEPAPLPQNTPREAQPLSGASATGPAPASPMPLGTVTVNDAQAKAPPGYPPPSNSAPTNPSAPRRTGFRSVGQEKVSNGNTPNHGASVHAQPAGPANQKVTFVAPLEPNDAEGSQVESPSQPLSAESSLAGSSFDDQLASLDSQLAMEVAQPPRDWNLAAIRAKANQLKDRGATPLERGRASLTLDRIGLYETHQKRAIELEVKTQDKATEAITENRRSASPGAPWKPADEEAEKAEAKAQEQPSADPAAKSGSWINKVSEVVGNGLKTNAPAVPTHFDAQGKLQRVRASDDSVEFPDYVLVNDEGAPIAFVGSPVLKLDKYVGKRIGVYGRRGMHSATQTPYIDAVEAVDLEVTQRNKPLRTTFGTLK